MKRRLTSIAILSVLFGFLSLHCADACTLWGATGDSVNGGGTLIAKNRDWAPDHRQEVRVLKPANGFRTLGLSAVGGTEPGMKAGVNEKGLVIVSATAGQVTEAEQRRSQQRKGLMRYLLATCASVDDLLGHLELMRRPGFYMAGDQKRLVVIEVTPEGRQKLIPRDSGTLAHTNHYFTINAQNLRKPGVSSTRRYARIEELLNGHKAPFDMEDFIRFSEDRNDGPDNSIWRIGSSPRASRTLAAWVVVIPVSGSPQLYFKMANPGETEWACRLSVEDALRENDRSTLSMESALCKGKGSK